QNTGPDARTKTPRYAPIRQVQVLGNKKVGKARLAPEIEIQTAVRIQAEVDVDEAIGGDGSNGLFARDVFGAADADVNGRRRRGPGSACVGLEHEPQAAAGALFTPGPVRQVRSNAQAHAVSRSCRAAAYEHIIGDIKAV